MLDKIQTEPVSQRAVAPPGKKERFYLPEVDGIRCVAFCLVWVHHYTPGPRPVLGAIHRNGWIGVDVFLILSSFLITSLLMIEQTAKGSISLPRFYSRRLLRIWPLLGLALCLNYLVLPAVNYFPGGFHNVAFLHDLRFHGIPNLLLLGNWSVAVFSYLHYGFVNHLWTINLEEQFYLLWPLLLVFLAARPQRLLLWCVCLIVVSYVARFYYVQAGFHHPALWVSTITRMDPLALGGILALLYRWREGAPSRLLPGWSIAFLSIIFLVAALISVTFILRRWQWSGDVWWKIGLADVCIAIAIGCVLNTTALAAILRLQPVAWLGKISYGLYVYHKFFTGSGVSLQIRSFAQSPFGAEAHLGPWMLGMLLNGLGVVAVSALSYYCFERCFLKFKERFETIMSRPA
jgi:peptidoglycan/LPS O-acetylase OafA/YrhL